MSAASAYAHWWLSRLLPLLCGVACEKARTHEPSATEHDLQIEPRVLDLGSVAITEGSHGHLVLKNRGPRALELTSVERSRFCTGGWAVSTIPVGGESRFEVTCRADLAGPLQELLTLHVRGGAEFVVKLDIRAQVVPILAFDPPIVIQDMRFGEPHVAETRLTGKLAKTARIVAAQLAPNGIDGAPASVASGGGGAAGRWHTPPTNLHASSKDSAVEVEKLPSGVDQPAGLRFRCKADQVGDHVGQITVLTDVPEIGPMSVSFGCKVKGTLDVTPTNPFFNLKRSGPWAQVVEVRSAQPDFRVKAARIIDGPFRASVELAHGDGTGRVKVEFDRTRYREESRGANGTLVIVTNDHTEPLKEVPLLAFGKLNPATAPIEGTPDTTGDR